MKNKNKRELEKYWAKEAVKKTKLVRKKTPSENVSKAAPGTAKQGTEL
jgi:hypothetical protein